MAEIELAKYFDVPVFELKELSELEAALSQIRGPNTFRATLDNLQLVASTLQRAADSDHFEIDTNTDIYAVDPVIVMGQEQRDQRLFLSFAPIVIALSAGFVALLLLVASAIVTLARVWPNDLLDRVFQ